MMLAALNVVVNVMVFVVLSRAEAAPEMGWAIVLLVAALNVVGVSDLMDVVDRAPRR